jgi:hypothetical protein
MFVCVLLMFGEPALLAFSSAFHGLGGHGAWRMRITPLQTISGLSSQPVHWRPDPWRSQVVAAALAAVVAWVGVAVAAGIAKRRRREPATI